MMPPTLAGLTYYHADVFSNRPLAGNGLTVFPTGDRLSVELMQQLTQEMRQFESIFLTATDDPLAYAARIFTMEEELGFAGHPVLGAASVLHYLNAQDQIDANWQLILPEKAVTVRTTDRGHYYTATMNQGQPTFGASLTPEQSLPFLQALNLSLTHLGDYPLQVVSTGLPYLIVPIARGLEQTRILHSEFAALLDTIGAKFVYVFDFIHREGRTWDNTGLVEDIATGSAAGPVGAYLVEHHLAPYDEPLILNQGRFVGRASKLQVQVSRQGHSVEVLVSGDVSIFSCSHVLGSMKQQPKRI